jgi:hypothetical protein
MDLAFPWARVATVTELLNAKEPKGWPVPVQGKGLFACGQAPRAI